MVFNEVFQLSLSLGGSLERQRSNGNFELWILSKQPIDRMPRVLRPLRFARLLDISPHIG